MGPLPTPAEAEALIRERASPLPVESRPLASLAGAVLAQSVRAERDQPPFDRVTMDGVALASSAWRSGERRFRIIGIQPAGRPALALPAGDSCIEVMTGAVLPEGCDCVVPVELIRQGGGWVEIGDDATVEPFANVHTRGLDCREGDMLLRPGTRLGAPEVAVLASAGLARADVRADPRIVVVSTGDELVDPGEPIESWQVRRSNAGALRAALALRGFSRVAEDHLPDDADILRARLATHLATHDVLVLSGGVSMGRFDHVPRALRDLGVTEVFHKVAQRPGKPMWFGVAAGGQAVYGLPGNPVSALVCLARYVVPGLMSAIGAGPQAVETLPIGAPFKVRPPLAFFLPVTLESSPHQGTVAMPRPTRGSGDFISLLGTDGFVELPPGPADYPAGTVAAFRRW
jgi:molybdopterin molybdotransferase